MTCCYTRCLSMWDCLSSNFRKAGLVLILLVCFTGCIPSTTHTSSLGGCPRAFVSGEKILMGEAVGISANQSYALYEEFEKQMREAGLQPAYAVEQKMYLLVNGIKLNEATDTSNLAKLQGLGYDYYLKLTVENQAPGLGYTSVSAEEKREMQQYGGAQGQDDETRATVQFVLYSMRERKPVYTLITTTKMLAISLPKDDYENGYRGSTAINASTISMAVEKALQKGTKELLKNCHCCQ